MGVHVIAVYQPRPGGSAALEAETVADVPMLRDLGLATERPSLVLRAPGGTIIEHFEWASREAIDRAHEHPAVLEMWARYADCCEFATLADLANAEAMFAEFEFVGSF